MTRPEHIAVTWWQAGTLLAGALCYCGAFILDLRALRGGGARTFSPGSTALGADEVPSPRHRVSALLVALGMALSIALMAWRAGKAHTPALALGDYFDAFILLSIMLAITWAYFQWTNHLRGVAVFLLPMIAALQVVGAALNMTGYAIFDSGNPWVAVHIGAVLLGSACFAAACVGAVVYLLADRQLRRRDGPGEGRWIGLPPLASLEKFMQRSTILGFALLTLAMLTGLLLQFGTAHTMGPRWLLSPKIILAALTWLVYAPLLHARLAPAFRGKRAAWLSIVGFALLLGVYISVDFIPAR